MRRPDSPLRLSAEDVADLQPISAALQDAIAQLGDFDFSARHKQFTMAFNRFRWEASDRAERVRTGVQFGHVLRARSQNIRQGADEAVVSLLSITFEPKDDPAGELVLTFAGGGELRLEVECIAGVMADVSAPWPASRRPGHVLNEEFGDPEGGDEVKE